MARNLLHVSKLEAFKSFCIERGWIQVAANQFEALRMINETFKTPLIVHERLKTAAGKPLVHLTTWGESEKLVREFLKSTSQKKKNESGLSILKET